MSKKTFVGSTPTSSHIPFLIFALFIQSDKVNMHCLRTHAQHDTHSPSPFLCGPVTLGSHLSHLHQGNPYVSLSQKSPQKDTDGMGQPGLGIISVFSEHNKCRRRCSSSVLDPVLCSSCALTSEGNGPDPPASTGITGKAHHAQYMQC